MAKWGWTRGITLGVMLIVLSSMVDATSMAESAKKIGLIPMSLIIIISVIRPFVGGFRASFASRKISNLTIWNATRGYVISSFGSIFLPSSVGGDLLRIEHIRKVTLMSRVESLMIVSSERISGLITLLLLAGVATPIVAIDGFDASDIWSIFFLILIGIVVVYFIIQRFDIGSRWSGVKQSASLLAEPRTALGLLSISLVFQCISLSVAPLVAISLAGPETALIILLITPIVALLTTLPISIGGMGVREVGYTALAGSMGVEIEVALLCGIAMSLSVVLSGLPGVLIQSDLFQVMNSDDEE
jgi:hypothetical protein